jgi:hypothetical protein
MRPCAANRGRTRRVDRRRAGADIATQWRAPAPHHAPGRKPAISRETERKIRRGNKDRPVSHRDRPDRGRAIRCRARGLQRRDASDAQRACVARHDRDVQHIRAVAPRKAGVAPSTMTREPRRARSLAQVADQPTQLFRYERPIVDRRKGYDHTLRQSGRRREDGCGPCRCLRAPRDGSPLGRHLERRHAGAHFAHCGRLHALLWSCGVPSPDPPATARAIAHIAPARPGPRWWIAVLSASSTILVHMFGANGQPTIRRL